MNQPLVSVIVPVYNGALFIENNIQSLLECSYKNLEILIGDDGSTDGTWEVLQKISQNPKVKVFHFEHCGAGAIRNELLDRAQGEFMAMQDADDKSDPDRFSKQIELFINNPSLDVTGTGSSLLEPSGKSWGEIKVKCKPSAIDWYFQRSMVHASIMIRKSALKECRYNESIQIGEDYFFMTCMYVKGKKFENIPEPLYKYYVAREDLRTKSARSFMTVFQAKMAISRLFCFPHNLYFIVINSCMLSLSALRGTVFKLLKKRLART